MKSDRNHAKLILASQSPRRKEILEQLGVSFYVVPAKGEETVSCSQPSDIVRELSRHKAEEIRDRLAAGAEALPFDPSAPGQPVLILGADTIVSQDGEILGKPADRQDAFRMIQKIQGRSHSVFTGVTVLVLEGGKEIRRYISACETRVTVNPMTDGEIRDYLETGEADDKAGAYGIQGRFCAWIGKIEGDYYNVVGLPAASVWEILKQYM